MLQLKLADYTFCVNMNGVVDLIFCMTRTEILNSYPYHRCFKKCSSYLGLQDANATSAAVFVLITWLITGILRAIFPLRAREGIIWHTGIARHSHEKQTICYQKTTPHLLMLRNFVLVFHRRSLDSLLSENSKYLRLRSERITLLLASGILDTGLSTWWNHMFNK